MDLVGKTLVNETGESYIILKVINYKGIKCAYAMALTEDSGEKEKKIFQISGKTLISIESKKMVSDITQMLIDSNDIKDTPRKIKNNEEISDYLKYLDDYYKTRVVTIM